MRPFRSGILALAALSVLSARPAPAETGKLLEAIVDVPRESRVDLDLSYEKSALLWVESHNDPQASDVEEAKTTDPKDITFILFRFHYKNQDYVKHKVKIRAILMDADGGVLGEGGRSGALDAQKADDTLTFPMKVKTLDWPKATKMKLVVTFLS
jgi:hypothetical protein